MVLVWAEMVAPPISTEIVSSEAAKVAKSEAVCVATVRGTSM